MHLTANHIIILITVLLLVIVVCGVIIGYLLFTKNKSSLNKGNNLECDKKVRNEIDSIIHTIAHDLKNPLTSIIGFSEVLSTSIRDKASKPDMKYLNRVYSNATHMNELLEGLMDFARSSQPQSIIEDLELGDILQEIISLQHFTIEETDTVINIPDDLPIVKTDKRKITHVFANLISNAIKFVPEGRAPAINISVGENGGYHEISVCDNGIGISENQLDEIFSLFYRAKELDAVGSGIGLAIVKRIVDDLSGQVRVTSKQGEGSIFTILLRK